MAHRFAGKCQEEIDFAVRRETPDGTEIVVVAGVSSCHCFEGCEMDFKDSNLGVKLSPDPADFLKLAEARMPFGKYAGTRLVDLPEPYVVWFSKKGFPEGQLGRMLQAVYEIKVNGLEYLFDPINKDVVR